MLGQHFRQRKAFIIAYSEDCESIFKTGAMGHQIIHGDRRVESFRNLQALQIAVHIFIKVNQSAFMQHHDSGPDKGLRHGTDAEQGVCPVCGDALLHIRLAIGLCKEDAPIPDHAHRDSGRAMFALMRGDNAVNISLQHRLLARRLEGKQIDHVHRRRGRRIWRRKLRPGARMGKQGGDEQNRNDMTH